mgnify:CR=1 FL=1
MALTPSEKKRKRRETINYKQKIRAQRDWDKYQYKITDLIDKSKLKPSDVAVGIAAATRPEYLERTLKSIASNPEILKWPFFAFLDAHPDSRQGHVTAQQEKMIHDYLPDCVVVKRPVNFGCGRSLIDLRRQLFDVLGYDRVFVVEDDCLISSSYFSYCMNLMDWAEETYSDVGTVQGHNFCVMGNDDKIKHLDKVTVTSTNWWAYLQHRKCWDSIKDTLYKFENSYLTAVDYSHRPHKAIRDWFVSLCHDGFPTLGDSPVATGKDEEFKQSKYFQSPPTGQDGATMVACSVGGWKRLAPSVNRTLYIGKQGIHQTPRQYASDGFDNIHMEDYDSDSDRKDFNLFTGNYKDLITENELSGLEGLTVIKN